jgi:hypothetical protein
MHINKRFFEEKKSEAEPTACRRVRPCMITPLSGPERLAHGEWLNRRPACADGMPSGLLGLRRRQSWPDGPFVSRPW